MNSVVYVSEKYMGVGGYSSTIEDSAIIFEKSHCQLYKEAFCDSVAECAR